MAFNIREFFKGLLISEENTNSPKQIQITPGGTSNTKTTLTSSQTTNKTVTLPDDTTTLVGETTTQNISNKTITNSTIDSTPIGQTVPAAVTTTSLVATTADINGGTIDNAVIGGTTPAAGTFTDLAADTLMLGGSTVVTEDAVQTLRNKSLEDTTTAIIDSVDPTKKIMFDAAGTAATKTTIASSQTVDRVLTLPDATDTLVARNTVDILTNKTLTTPAITNPDIDGGTIDGTTIGSATPAAAQFTTVDTTSDLNVGGNAVITGDFTVNGTTTTINTQNLDVEDKNITVNKNGNDVSAEGAGLTVDRTSTDGSLIYKDSSASKWAAGPLGSEVDLVGTTSTQTLTNKTLTSPTVNTPTISGGTIDNTIIGGTTPAAGTFTSMTSTTATVGGAAVTTAANSQTLTNKTIQFLQQAVSTDNTTTGVVQTLPVPTTGVVRVTNSSLSSLAGITAGASGQSLILENKTGATVSILNEDGGATAANRILTGTAATVSLTNNASLFLIYDTTSSRWQLIGGTGSGSGSGASNDINYITNGNAESGTTGWTLYNDGASSRPVDGTGGTPAGITFSTTTTNPLRGINGFTWTKAGTSNYQGNGVSYDFTINNADKAKPLTISFDYIVTSLGNDFTAGTTSTDSDMIVYMYDVTNSQLIEPSNIRLYSNSTTIADRYEGTFQTSATGTQYRLIFHQALSGVVSYSLQIDNIIVSPVNNQGFSTTIAQDRTAYTPTLTGFGAATNVEFYYTIIGDRLFIEGSLTAGTYSGVECRISLPGSYTIKTQTATTFTCGTYGRGESSANHGGFVLAQSGLGYVVFSDSATFSNTAVNSLNSTTALSSNSTRVAFNWSVPVSQLSSGILLAHEADQRVCTAKFGISTTNLATTVNTNIVFPTVSFDTHGAYNNSTGIFTVPVAGYYKFNLNEYRHDGNAIIRIHKGGTYQAALAANAVAAITFQSGAAELSLTAGDQISFQPTVSGNIQYSASNYQCNITVERMTGPSAILATELISARATTVAGQSIANGATSTVVFGTESYDSHTSFNSSTGVFTAPVPGKYAVAASLRYASASFTATTAITVQIFKNGSLYSIIGSKTIDATVTAVQQVNGFDDIDLIAGDTIDIRTSHGEGTARSLSTTAGTCFVSIKKSGF